MISFYLQFLQDKKLDTGEKMENPHRETTLSKENRVLVRETNKVNKQNSSRKDHASRLNSPLNPLLLKE